MNDLLLHHLEIVSLEELRRIILDVRSKLSGRVELFLRRDYILEDAIPYYKNDEILKHHIYVQFEGEVAEDIDGVSKEFLSCFWEKFLNVYGRGENLKYFVLHPLSPYSKELFSAVARILFHGMIMFNFLPITIAPCILYSILFSGLPSKEMCGRSLMSSLSESDKNTVKDALQSVQYSDQLKVDLSEFLSRFDLPGLPIPVSFPGMLDSIAFHEIISSPFFMLKDMIYVNSFGFIREHSFEELIQNMKPNGERVKELLHAEYTEPQYFGLEEKVFGYVTRFVASLDAKDLSVFLRFVTGLEVIPDKITVQYTGVTNREVMFPVGHLCGNTVDVSRFYMSYEHLKKSFMEAMYNRHTAKTLNIV